MEPVFQAHPLPQNVTNFEFHLVGDMTLKQFGYLAAGLGMAYLMFVLFAAAAPIIAYPLILLFGGSGVAFAFLPIQERPLDHWAAAFYKAIFKPTQLEFKSAVLSSTDPLFKNRLNLYLKAINRPDDILLNIKVPSLVDQIKTQQQNLAQNPQPVQVAPVVLNQAQQVPAQNISIPTSVTQVSQPIAQPVAQPMPNPLPPQNNQPDSQELQKTVELAKEAQVTKTKILDLEQSINKIKQQAATPGSNPQDYARDFQKLLTDLNSLNEHASQIAHELAILTHNPQKVAFKPAVSVTPTPQMSKPKTIPSITLTTFPNVINGMVVDSASNYIEGAIIVAHDKQGLPVRALKSNKLGQFIAATPLPNGTYALGVEKDNLSFDQYELTLKGEVLKPVVIYAKKLN